MKSITLGQLIIDSPSPRSRCSDEKEDETIQDGSISTVQIGVEASWGVPEEIGKCHMASHQKRQWAREDTKRNERSAEEFENAGY